MTAIQIIVGWAVGILLISWSVNVLQTLVAIRKELAEIRKNLAKTVDDTE